MILKYRQVDPKKERKKERTDLTDLTCWTDLTDLTNLTNLIDLDQKSVRSTSRLVDRANISAFSNPLK